MGVPRLIVQTVFQSLAGSEHEELDGSFAAFEPLSNVEQREAARIAQLNRLAGALPELTDAMREMCEKIFVRFAGTLVDDFVQFQAQFGPGDFLATFQFPQVLFQEVAGNSQQPGANETGGVKSFAGLIEPEKDLLSQVLGVTGGEKPGSQIGEHAALVLLNDGLEGGSVVLQQTFAEFLV